MPLSEHEQRLLEQLERALYAEDPKFASALQGADVRSHYRRRALQAAVGVVLGVALLIAGLIIRLIPVSVIGAVVMFVCAGLAVTSYRRIPAPGEIVRPRRPRRGRQKKQRVRFVERVEERWRRRQEGGFGS